MRFYDSKRMEQQQSPRRRLAIDGAPSRCPYCHDMVDADSSFVVCHTCLARHHATCWVDHGSCSSCGEVRGLRSDEDLVVGTAVEAGPTPAPLLGSKISVTGDADRLSFEWDGSLSFAAGPVVAGAIATLIGSGVTWSVLKNGTFLGDWGWLLLFAVLPLATVIWGLALKLCTKPLEVVVDSVGITVSLPKFPFGLTQTIQGKWDDVGSIDDGQPHLQLAYPIIELGVHSIPVGRGLNRLEREWLAKQLRSARVRLGSSGKAD